MPLDWSPLVKLVSIGQRFLLTTHVRPDGDAIGSLKGLGNALRTLGKEVVLVTPSAVGPRYEFMDPRREIIHFTPPGSGLANVDAMIVLDTGTWNQLADVADLVRGFAGPRLVIDHHMTQDDLGATRLVDTSAEANARLVYEAVRALSVEVSAEIAMPLFVGLAMDTGWFRHSNTTAQTFLLASELVAKGAKPAVIHQQLFDRNSMGRLKLMGLVLSRLTVLPAGNVAYSFIEKADYLATGAIPPDSEDLVNFTMSLNGIEIGILFMEQPRGGIKVSFRSHVGYNVAKLAEKFGGGGHAQAAGATLHTPLADAQIQIFKAI